MTPIPSTPIEMKGYRADRAYTIATFPKAGIPKADFLYLRRKKLLAEYNVATQKQIFFGTPLPDRLRGIGRPG